MIRLFRHYVPKSYLILGILESLVLFGSVYLAYELRFLSSQSIPADELGSLSYRALLYVFVILSTMTAMGLYWRHRKEGELWDFILRISVAFLLGIMLLAVLFYLFPIFEIGRGVLGITLILSLFGISFARLIHWRLSDHDLMKRRIIVLGTGKQASLMERLRRKSDNYGFKIIGYVHMHGEMDVVDNYKILPSIQSLRSAIEEYEVDEIVVALDDRRKNFPVDEILDCKMEGISISDISTFFEAQTEKIRLDTLHPSSMIFSSGFDRAIHNNYRKRIFDVVSTVMLLLATWPVMLFIAIAIYVESGFSGPIFYKQERVGKDGKSFNVLKFRSMRTDAEKDGKAQWAKENDDRVTRIGRIIRMTRIDELPQLINVLKGEMSFVGPRPERPQFVDELSQSIPFYKLRHKVNPGITGWAQISYPYGSSHRDAIEKLQYDLYYIKHYSVIFDMMILFQTAQAVLWSKGAR